ncbi:hypothetical protein [uncultured Azohydromonas sp.]|jgi:hypothetical protein|uniref:AbiU2 domain-containing protein n=1 Tax=uncultured Azohydromonas sp. TaxID=487342 RepID=UPI0026268793|nr:hypothetical protein [uncultured Azohydromonas sp.]
MSALSARIVEEFCKLCDWSYQVWINHRELFDDNHRTPELLQSKGAHAFERLRKISHEYTILQIAKLHDGAVVSGNITLGIDYIVKFGGWSPAISLELERLAGQLSSFSKQLRAPRNQLLSHNDLAAILSGNPLGEFNPGEDIKYFEVLQNFVNIVHNEVMGTPFPFDDLAENDAEILMAMINS